MTLHCGDCLDVLKTLPAGSVDAVVTDPPAGIAFMGKDWDAFGGRCNGNAQHDRAAANQGPGAGLGNQPFGYSGSALPKTGQRSAFLDFLTERLAEALRVAKPGAHLLCWAIPRTSHWTGTAIEDAGWIIEDRISHLFGTGFPKHKSKLKPAVEDWWKARKPLTLDASTDIILQTTNTLEAYLWLMSPASLVDAVLKSIPPESAKPNTVRWLAGMSCVAESPERSGTMATFSSPEAASTFWSIVLLWSGILAASSRSESTFTTETATSLTTALRTLNCFLLATIPEPIIQAVSSPNGLTFSAKPAASPLESARASWHETHIASVVEPVTRSVLNTLVSVAESLSLAIDTSQGVFAPVSATTADDSACEDWWLATKPGGSKWLNVDGCRIGTGGQLAWEKPRDMGYHRGMDNGTCAAMKSTSGRWPANVVLDEEAAAALDRQSGERPNGYRPNPCKVTRVEFNTIGKESRRERGERGHDDSGGASRFFYCAKASRRDRDEGNTHPTVKSTDLMRWLCRLVTPAGGVILDPFAGTGSTGKAAIAEGFGFVGIEQSAEYHAIATQRIEAAQPSFTCPASDT